MAKETESQARAHRKYRGTAAYRKYGAKYVRVKRERIHPLKTGPSVDCGGHSPPEAMDFDHIRGEKLKSVSLMLNHSLDAILEEIAKCELVCANCHRVRTKARQTKARQEIEG